ncbi:MAG TPA: hypothetical protein DCK76_05860 [Desulfotomaculum sp.]|nr:hypothetical protein [Desulfotomaculum sp.]HBY04829.1 hypothetical protein [Desulfotomaculum sp.]
MITVVNFSVDKNNSGELGAEWGYLEWNSNSDGEINATIASSDDGVTFGSGIAVANGDKFDLTGQFLKITINLTRGDDGSTPVLYDLTVKPANNPPDCSNATPSIGVLWPADNKFVNVDILGVVDPDADDEVKIAITSVTSDEATGTIKGAGGKVHTPDAIIVDGDTVQLRAERSGTSDGRVYVINFTATDLSGAQCSGSISVCVPHDQSSKAVDSGQEYDATVPN